MCRNGENMGSRGKLLQDEILQIAVPSALKLTEIQIANDSVAGHLG